MRNSLDTTPDIAPASVGNTYDRMGAQGRSDLGGLRVLYVADRRDAPYRYRCVHGCLQLREAGVTADVAQLHDADLLARLPSYSLIVLFRVGWSARVAQVVERARSSGARVAYEVDDLIFDPAAEPLIPFLERLGAEAQQEYRSILDSQNRTLQAADVCIGATEAIARSARAFGRPAIVHPNLLSREYLHLSRIVYAARPLLGRRPVIGYMSGSNTHDGDFESIAGALVGLLLRRPDTSLLVCGFLELPSALRRLSGRIARFPYQQHTVYPWLMARCAAVVAPLERINDFTEAKSALKAFEAGVFGIPAIASPSAPYLSAIKHGSSGFIARTEADWLEALLAVLEPGQSARMGASARALALAQYSPDAYAGVLAHALVGIAGRATGGLPAPPAPELPMAAALRLLERARRVRQSLRIAAGRAAGVPSRIEPATEVVSRDAPLVRQLAALPRRGRVLMARGRSVGAVLLDREHPACALPHDRVLARGDGSLELVDTNSSLLLEPAPWPTGRRAELTLVLQMWARCAAGQGRFRLCWRDVGEGFAEERSIQFPIVADGLSHTYLVKLDRNTGLPPREVSALRIDVLGAVGEAEIPLLAALTTSTLPPIGAGGLRVAFGQRFLRGNGIEIGALQNPMPLPAYARVRYVDRIPVREARKHYPELEGQRLVEPEIIAEADRLTPVASNTQDFVICNHVLEHLRDPISALQEWLRVLKPGGHLYVSVPDHKNPLDRVRPVTPFEHIVEDARDRCHRTTADGGHFLEWVHSVSPALPDDERRARARLLERQAYAIHFHVFDEALFDRLLAHVCSGGRAEIVERQREGEGETGEHIAVLRKPASAHPVDIVIPVYNAREYTRRCIDSVLAHATGDWRLVLVNDASTEPGLAEDLAASARNEPRITVLTNARNQGFVATANRGMRVASGRDVLLLNSDTEVFAGFLDRFRMAAHADRGTGILSPFSNNATICSIPDFPHDNPIPEGYTPERFAELVSACSRRSRPEIVTAVGFCMYVKSDVFERVGYFDEETFGRGYGEENDLCERAKKAGFTIRLCDDVFVYHKGKASFGAEGLATESKSAAERLEAKQPGYHAAVARFIRRNPLAPLHERVRFHMRRLAGSAQTAILFTLHDSPFARRPGGTEFHVRDLLRALRLPRVVLAYPEPGGVGVAEILDGRIDERIGYYFATMQQPGLSHLDALKPMVRQLVEAFQIRAAHVHHLMRWPLDLGVVLAECGVPYVMTHHDFHALCPNWNMFNRFRLEPCRCKGQGGDAESECLAAFYRAMGTESPGDPLLVRRRHRTASAESLTRASAHIFPSRATRETFEAHMEVPLPRPLVIEHGHDGALRVPRSRSGKRLRLAIVGEVAHPIKGADRYMEVVTRTRDLPVEWHFFGDVTPFDFDQELRALKLGDRLVLHGPYVRDQISDLLAASGVDLCVILPAVDESFGFVLSEALIAGIPAIASARGALPERLARHGAGRTVESAGEAAQVIAGICEDRSELDAWTEGARRFRHRTMNEDARDHLALYEELGWLSTHEARALEPERFRWLDEARMRAETRTTDGADVPLGWKPILQGADKATPFIRRALRRTGKRVLRYVARR